MRQQRAEQAVRTGKKEVNTKYVVGSIAIKLDTLNFEKDILATHYPYNGARGSVVVKALCYKPEGHRFHIR
jgi:hypothetical protein